MNELATIKKIEQSKLAIRDVKSLDEIKHILDQGEAMRAYAKSSQMSAEIQRDISEIIYIAKRRFGELSLELNTSSGMRTDLVQTTDKVKGAIGSQRRSKTKTEILAEMKVDRRRANEAEKMAKLPEEVFKKRMATAKAATEKLTKSLFISSEEEYNIAENSKAIKRIGIYKKTGEKPAGWREGIDDELLRQSYERDDRMENNSDRTEQQASAAAGADKHPLIKQTLDELKKIEPKEMRDAVARCLIKAIKVMKG